MDIHVLTRILHGKILAVYLALRHVRVALFVATLCGGLGRKALPW